MRNIVLKGNRRAIDVMPIFGVIKMGISSYINKDDLGLTVVFIYYILFICTYLRSQLNKRHLDHLIWAI